MRNTTLTPVAPIASVARPHSHPLVLPPPLHIAETPAAAVLAAVRLGGPIARDAVADVTSLSVATVNRQVTALLDVGLLRERPDLATAGAVGRPRIPVVLNHGPFLSLGVHIGARTTSIVATDLSGRALDVVEMPTPRGSGEAALASLAGSAQRYLSRWHKRRPLCVGVAVGGVVDSRTGHVDHARLDWQRAPAGPVFAETLGLPVSVAAHVDAMAGAELLLGLRQPGPDTWTSLYVYARETVGYALVIDGRVHRPATGPGTVAGLPVSSELLGGSGALESAVSDEAVLAAADRLRIGPGGPNSRAGLGGLLRAARGGNQSAAELLRERARVLGEAVALLRDLLNPDDLVVGGQAFTEYPEGMAAMQAAYRGRSTLPPRAIRLTAFGNRVQEAGAGIVSLACLYADPVATMRRLPGGSPRRRAAREATG